MRKLIEKYGSVNCIIVIICSIALVINSVIVEKSSLYEISDDLTIAYILNFLAGCQGILGKWGSMSFEKTILHGQIWRCFTHIYLHAGLIHMVMNMLALLTAGKYVEKKYGSIWYVLFFHAAAIIDAVITALIFPGESVGASAGIFAVIGILVILIFKKQISIKKTEILYLTAFFVLSLMLGAESLVIHLLALAIGLVVGSLMKKAS
ncbi:MAG: rhomboid family intramembrane serine protease [Oscillospiraceae bacterium]|nr:rhomboid family intramembrane serine protease [Oscillospiraceae bacterium]